MRNAGTILANAVVALAVVSACLNLVNGEEEVLNLHELCADNHIYYCTLSNLSATTKHEAGFVVDVQVPHLMELVVRDSKLYHLPLALMENAPALQSLVLHRCHLQSLTNLSEYSSIRKLVIQYNPIAKLYGNTFKYLHMLEELHLGHNVIQSLDYFVFDTMIHLVYLDLQHNYLTTVQDVFNNLEHLEYIDLSYNMLELIDEATFFHNPHLRTVILAGNKFHTFAPSTLHHLEHLQLVDISDCIVKSIVLLQVDTLLAQSASLEEISLDRVIKMHADNNDLEQLNVREKSDVRELRLHRNKLTSLDNFIGMRNLQHLDVSKNQIRTLSTSHSPQYLPLPSLTNLNLSYNQLGNVSDTNFLLLPKLTQLDLAFNKLQQLAAEDLSPLTQLERLYIEGNNLKTFDYEYLCHNHGFLRELGLYKNDWGYDYKQKMFTYLQKHNIHLPIRFAQSNMLVEKQLEGVKAVKGDEPHHHHHQLILEGAGTHNNANVAHSHHIRRDALAVLTLCLILVILLLQMYRLMQSKYHSLANFCCSYRKPATISSHMQQRLSEDDSEV